MTLKNLLRTLSRTPSSDDTPAINKVQNDNSVFFYHFSQNMSDLDSFIKNGAQPIGKGVGGQTDGFYCWTKENGFLSRLLTLNKSEGLLITIKEHKVNLSYPLWQLDTEGDMGGLFKNTQAYAPFLEKNAQNLNIKMPDNVSSHLQTITGMHYNRIPDSNGYQDEVIFTGISKTGEREKHIVPVYHSNPNKNGWHGGFGTAGLRQILVDYLCQNHPQFKEEYNKHMLNCIQNNKGKLAEAIKYTGQAPLKIFSAKEVGFDKNNQLFEKKLYSAPNNQKIPHPRKGRGDR